MTGSTTQQKTHLWRVLFFPHYLLRGLVTRQERRAWSPASTLIVASFTGIIRGLEEAFLFGKDVNKDFVISTIPMYFMAHLMLTFILARLTAGSDKGVNWKRTANAANIGVFLGVFPPVIDFLVTPAIELKRIFYTYYIYWSPDFIPFTLYDPKQGVPFGEAVVLWFLVFFCGWYTAVKTRSVLRTIIGALCGYAVILFLTLSVMPFLVRFKVGLISAPGTALPFMQEQMDALVGDLMVWQTLIAGLFYLLLRPGLFGHLYKRINHYLPWLMLYILGAQAAYPVGWRILPGLVVILLACIATIFQNDHFDRIEDAKMGRRRMFIEKNDVDIFNWFFAFAAVGMYFSDELSVLILIPFFIVSILYNYPFYKAKHSFPLALKVEGVWGGGAFLAGAMNYMNKIDSDVLLASFLVFGGTSILTAQKDLKDIRGDKSSGSTTSYLYFINKGYSLKSVHFWHCTCSALCLTLPVFWAVSVGKALTAGLLTFVCVLPYAYLTFNTTLRRWFEYVLIIMSLYVFILIITAR